MAALISGFAAMGERYHAPVIRPDNRPKQPRQPKQYRYYTARTIGGPGLRQGARLRRQAGKFMLKFADKASNDAIAKERAAYWAEQNKVEIL